MVPIQDKKLGVIKCAGFPLIDAMALLAVTFNLLMEIVLGFCVATGTIAENFCFDKRMRKRLATVLGQLGSGMVAMAGNTILFQ